MINDTTQIPYGYCHCGCGQKTKLETRTSKDKIIGQPRKFLLGHGVRKFWDKVNKDGSIPAHCPELGACWEWTGSYRPNGYGRFGRHDKERSTHRISYEIAYGAIPDGLSVLHKCDNKKCCNPEHLFLGTQKDNMQDKIKKNRQHNRNGDRCPTTVRKLDSKQVKEIRDRYSLGGISQQKLGDEYGVGASAIWKIVHFERWTE